MIELIKEIDASIVLFINNLCFDFFSDAMWFISAKSTWIPLYLMMLFYLYKKMDRKTFILLSLTVVSSVAIADLLSVHLFKNVFMRYRPSHHLVLGEQLNLYQLSPGNFYKGGQYGFVSSHAANFTALACMFIFGIKNTSKTWLYVLVFVVFVTCLSRVYLGVHYFTDVFFGSLLGALIAFLLYKLIFIPIQQKL